MTWVCVYAENSDACLIQIQLKFSHSKEKTIWEIGKNSKI